MNRVLRAGLLALGLMLFVGVAAWVGGGGGGYGGSPEYYPVTVRMWLDDAFVGGTGPAPPGITPGAAVLEMLAAGNDLVYVDDEAPRCPVWTVAWVSPAPGTPLGAQVYKAAMRCAAPDASPVPDAPTLGDLLERAGP